MSARIPTFRGRRHRSRLFRLYGLPNVWPSDRDVKRNGALAPFRRARVLFVDDDRDGAPVAFWLPSRWSILVDAVRRWMKRP